MYQINENVSNLQIEERINQIIKKEISSKFDPIDYKIEINGVNKQVYDYVLYIYGVRTDLGYSIIMENNKILSVYDNTRGLNIEKLKTKLVARLENKILTAKDVSNYTNRALSETKRMYHDSKLRIKDEITYFNTEEEKLYQVTLIEVENSYGLLSVVEHYEEIN